MFGVVKSSSARIDGDVYFHLTSLYLGGYMGINGKGMGIV